MDYGIQAAGAAGAAPSIQFGQHPDARLGKQQKPDLTSSLGAHITVLEEVANGLSYSLEQCMRIERWLDRMTGPTDGPAKVAPVPAAAAEQLRFLATTLAPRLAVIAARLDRLG